MIAKNTLGNKYTAKFKLHIIKYFYDILYNVMLILCYDVYNRKQSFK